MIIIIITITIKQICIAPLGHNFRTSEALGPGSVLVSRGKRKSLAEEVSV